VFQKPSVIQSQAWPVVLQGRDFVGVARTGSGKTLSFIVPAIVHVMAQNVLQKGDGPVVLVMAPTRELAVQIEQEAKKFASCCQLSTLAVYGGAPKYEQ
jgi:ATP-dependent RNA helicase DDX5/DBP2